MNPAGVLTIVNESEQTRGHLSSEQAIAQSVEDGKKMFATFVERLTRYQRHLRHGIATNLEYFISRKRRSAEAALRAE